MSANENERIAPHAEAGFGSVDVLAEAEMGHSIELELDFYDGSYEFISGTVQSVNTEDADDEGRMRRKNIHVNPDGEYESLVINVEFDTKSAHATVVGDVRFTKYDSDEYDHRELDDLAMCELVGEAA